MKVKNDHRSNFFPVQAIGKKKPEKKSGLDYERRYASKTGFLRIQCNAKWGAFIRENEL